MLRTTAFALIASVVLLSSASRALAQHEGHTAAPAVKEAVAVINGTKGNEKVTGVVRFTEIEGGVKVVAVVEGLTPGGKHGFHIHEFGDPSSGDGMSAGGHFNPAGDNHGAPGHHVHVGDMGNLQADDKGVAKVEITLPTATILGKNAIIGRGVIVHAKEDDLKTQPTGNAGARIGVGVIGVAFVKKG